LQHELFHLDRDPAEMYNVYEQNKEIASRLRARMKTFAEEIGTRLLG
jgi:hypothetical protein